MFLRPRIHLLILGLMLALPLGAQAPAPSAAPALSVSVVGGYLLVHLPGENVTVVGQPAGGEDTGWASWSQRGELLWRGEMEDAQGRRYNVRILPGFVAPWTFAQEGWSDAGHDLGEYGDGQTWSRMGRHAQRSFEWGWNDFLWDFGLKGSKRAWSDNFTKAGQRTARRTFGWPLAYPWAFVASAFESVLRVPLGVAGAALGTAGGVVTPVAETVWPTAKATWHGGVDGVVLPVAGWSWHTVASPFAAALASAPSPSRADGTWMKLMAPEPAKSAPIEVTEPVLADLTTYAHELAALDGDQGTSLALLEQRQRAERDALRARHDAETRQLQEARAERLKAWAAEPAHRDLLARLAHTGGDPATLRAARTALTQRLTAAGLPEPDAKALVERLAAHPLTRTAPAPTPHYDKTDPLRGAADTVKRL